MKEEKLKCDIADAKHLGNVETYKIPVMFDHDQNDGKSKTEPYFEMLEIEICDSCYKQIIKKRRIIYAYGAMGHNNYYLNNQS